MIDYKLSFQWSSCYGCRPRVHVLHSKFELERHELDVYFGKIESKNVKLCMVNLVSWNIFPHPQIFQNLCKYFFAFCWMFAKKEKRRENGKTFVRELLCKLSRSKYFNYENWTVFTFRWNVVLHKRLSWVCIMQLRYGMERE